MKLYVLPNRFTRIIWAMFAALISLGVYPLMQYLRDMYITNTEFFVPSEAAATNATFAFMSAVLTAMIFLFLLSLMTKAKKRKLEKAGHMVLIDDDSPFI